MRTCIAVRDLGDNQVLAFIQGSEVQSRMESVCEALHRLAKDPGGDGREASPFIVDSFPTIVGYIDKRQARKTGKMFFRFFGVDMYQNGNDTGDEQNAYYIGLKAGGTLSYPDMREQIDKAAADPAIKPDGVKAATGIAATNRFEMLAIACLFIAEGRRDRVSLVTHLLLCDLISDAVRYGSGGQKLRTLGTAIDKGKTFVGKYAAVTAAGDSPMSQKNAVAHSEESRRELGFGRRPLDNRYYDKTVSLMVQWFVNYYRSLNHYLQACRASDEKNLAKIDRQIEDHIALKIGELTFKKGTKAAKKRIEEGKIDRALRPRLIGLKEQVLSELSAMVKVKIDKAAAGEAGNFSFQSDQKVDTKLLKEVLAAL